MTEQQSTGKGTQGGGTPPARQLPADLEAALLAIAALEPSAEAARLLAVATGRAVAMLHKLARDEATRTKGTSEWANWAKLVNASRSAVLAATSCRDVATDLSARAVGPPGSTNPPGSASPPGTD